jgi:hypothetical protein
MRNTFLSNVIFLFLVVHEGCSKPQWQQRDRWNNSSELHHVAT